MSTTPQNEADDLGTARYDADTAAFGDRDASAHLSQRIRVRPTRAAIPGTEDKILEWKTFQYVTDDVDEREERKGDLHGGQLHRENRAAARVLEGQPPVEEVRGGGRGKGKKREDGVVGVLQAGVVKKGERAPPLAKGYPEEVSREEAKELFWSEPIVRKSG